VSRPPATRRSATGQELSSDGDREIPGEAIAPFALHQLLVYNTFRVGAVSLHLGPPQASFRALAPQEA